MALTSIKAPPQAQTLSTEHSNKESLLYSIHFTSTILLPTIHTSHPTSMASPNSTSFAFNFANTVPFAAQGVS